MENKNYPKRYKQIGREGGQTKQSHNMQGPNLQITHNALYRLKHITHRHIKTTYTLIVNKSIRIPYTASQ